ncbi:hypothetical protein LPJ56_000527 [Coemansia sp. RSA 2599]|nr:hypothetical protein LPJ75_000215 [Coemansia sp. RSA 2598]KAJ1829225.1 hypothetical protein LPJ56_000527 [Coemansia sp. RSA 2599]
MTRRRQEITEKVPTTPRKVVVYTDNLMTSNSARNTAASESSNEASNEIKGPSLAHSLADTLNTALVISTSFRFDPELNMLEILDPYNPRNNIQVKGITDYKVSVKLFMLSASADASNRPSALYVRQAMACLHKQLGPVKIDELVVSFSDLSSAVQPNGVAHRRSSSLGTNGLASMCSSPNACFSSDASAASSLDAQHRHAAEHLANEESAGAARISNDDGGGGGSISSISSASSNDNDAGGKAGGEADMTRYLKVWKALTRIKQSGEAVKIGISDVSKQQLEQLCQQSGSKPDIVQIRLNVHEPVEQDMDDELRGFARQANISVSAHADGPEILAERRFQHLASDFKINERFPTTEVPPQGYKMDFMRPRWVANYNVLQTKRGLVANRGYIVMASSDCVLDPNRISRPAYSIFGGL